jgi:hypothetical protein
MNNSSSSFWRKGLTKEWKIEYINLMWASFFSIEDKDWNKLNYKENSIFNIEFSIEDKDIETLSNKDYWKGKTEWYYYFDKEIGLWKITDAKYTLDKENKILKVETSKLY